MSTVGAMIERLYRTYLYPPDYEPALVPLDSDILAADTDDISTFTVGTFVVPEDEELLRIGSLIEIESELIRVVDYNPNTKEVSGKRGQRGSAAVAHATGVYITLTPSYPRLSVFEAVRDNIVSLYPKLGQVKAVQLVTVDQNVAGVEDELAVEVVSIWLDDWSDTNDWDGKIVDYHPNIGGRAVILNNLVGTFWLRYRRRMAVVTSEADDLAESGVEPNWENIVLIGACADLMSGRDIPQVQADYIGAVLQAENIPAGTRSSIAVGLARYRELLMDRAEKEMRAEYKVKVHMRDPFAQRSRGFFG